MNENYNSPMTPPISPVGPSTPPSLSPLVNPPAAKKNWWLVVVLAVIIVLAAGYYFYYYSAPNVGPEVGLMMKSREMVPEETAALENDLQTMPLNDLDADLNNIDKELGK